MRRGLISGMALLSIASFATCGTVLGSVAQAAQRTTVHQQKVHNMVKLQHIDLTILPGTRLGPDNIMHDIFSPADFSVVQGVPVKVSIYNYDGGPHSFTSGDLGLNVQIKGHVKAGVPSVTTFEFTPAKTGSFTWECVVTCDGQAKGWAMSHDGYMMGKVNVVPNQHEQFITLTVDRGVRFGPPRKTKKGTTTMHDAFTPADFTVTAGVPVHVTVVNYDDGLHSITAPEIGLNKIISASPKDGVPGVTSFTFTVSKPGKYKWQCEVKCDGGMTSYGMTHEGYMVGTITAVK